MKYFSITVVTLAAAAAAQPHPRQHQHQHLHVVKRQTVVTEVVTTTQVAEVLYVNQNGQPISTSYPDQATSTADTIAPAAVTTPTSSQKTSNFIPPAPETTEPASTPSATNSPPTPTTSSPVASVSSSSPTAPSPSTSDNGNTSTSSFGYGLSYSPYNNDGTCKSQYQVSTDFDAFGGYGFIRSYGVDCNQVPLILAAASAKGMKMFAGIYDIGDVVAETQELIDAAKHNWDSIYAVTVGNEAVNDGVATVDQVVSAVSQARSMLQAAGYTGPVATVDTSAQIIANPQLCQVSDFAAANCHAFFNADLTANQAGPWVLEQAQRVAEVCGKETMITESGWPTQGDANGMAVPSTQNMVTAIQSLKSSFSNNIVLFSAFNNLWETNTPATFGTNQYWGIYGYAPA